MVMWIREAWSMKVVLLGAAALMFAAGFCVFDDHAGAAHHDHGMSLDLCLGVLGIVTVVAPLIALSASGSTVALLTASLLPVPLHVRKPPPKLVPVR